MPVERQILEVPLAGGLSQKLDDKLVQPGSVLESVDTEQDKTGLIKRRPGAVVLSTTKTDIEDSLAVSPITKPKEIYEYDGNLYLRNNTKVYLNSFMPGDIRTRYRKETNNTQVEWSEVGSVLNMDFEFIPVVSAALKAAQWNIDMALLDGSIMFVYNDLPEPGVSSSYSGDVDLSFVLWDSNKKVAIQSGLIATRSSNRGVPFGLQAVKEVAGEEDSSPFGPTFVAVVPILSGGNNNVFVYKAAGDGNSVPEGGWDLADTDLDGYSTHNNRIANIDVSNVFLADDSVLANTAFYYAYTYDVNTPNGVLKVVAVAPNEGSTDLNYAEPVNFGAGGSYDELSHLSVTAESDATVHLFWHEHDGSTAGASLLAYRAWSLGGTAQFSEQTIDNTTGNRYGPLSVILTPDESEVVLSYTQYSHDAYTDKDTRTSKVEVITRSSSTGASSTTHSFTSYNCELLSHPFFYDNNLYVPVVYASTEAQRSAFLLDGSGNVVARLLMGNATDHKDAGSNTQNNSGLSPMDGRILPKSIVDGDTVYICALRRSSILTGNDEVDATQCEIGYFAINMDPIAHISRTSVSGLNLASGPLPHYTDKIGIFDQGFNIYPDYIAGAGTSSGNAFSGDVTVSGKVLFSHVDSKNNIHRSAPSPASDSVSVDSGSGEDNVSWSYQPATLMSAPTSTLDRPRVDLYRTEDGPGSVYYFELTEESDGSVVTGTVLSDVTDANLTSGLVLYTESGELENIALPASHYITSNEDRVFSIIKTDRKQVWFSKPVVTGYAPEFNEAFSIRSKFEVECLAVLDSRLLLFGEDDISVVAGDGPNALGEGSFSDPQSLPTDVGCINKQSLVTLPEGVIFQSKKGLCMLGRSLDIQYIGFPVDDYENDFIYTTVLDAANSRVFFVQKDRTLVLDYYHKRWDTWSQGGKSACLVAGTLHILGFDDKIYKFSGEFTHDLEAFGFKVRTPWIKIGALESFQRLRKIALTGDNFDKASVRVKVYQDYNDKTPVETIVFDKNNQTKDSTFGARAHLSNQKCKSVMFEVEEIDVPHNSEGVRLNSITMELGMKRGLAKFSSDRSE